MSFYFSIFFFCLEDLGEYGVGIWVHETKEKGWHGKES